MVNNQAREIYKMENNYANEKAQVEKNRQIKNGISTKQ